MIVSGISGNELYCLHLKGFEPGDIVVGNSVNSLGLVGGLGAFGRNLAGGEISNVTSQISEGRHAAIERMEAEAKKHGANGVTGVVSDIRTLAGYTEFLAQGTGVIGPNQHFFSSATSGMELFCHLDAGYVPIRFSMGIVAYALGIGRGLMGSFRTLGRGEVKEFSDMYNDIRHTALNRLRTEAAGLGANAVVDIKVSILPYGPGSVELLMTGTSSHNPRFSSGVVTPDQVRTSELTGEALWNLAALGYAPLQLCMATSVYSLGVVGSIGSALQGLSRGELPELTHLIYGARENALDLLRREAERYGADRVIGNRLMIRELSPGLIEVVAIGTAVKRMTGIEPATPQLPPQAIIVDRGSLENESVSRREQNIPANAIASSKGAAMAGGSAAIQLIMLAFGLFFALCVGGLTVLGAFLDSH